MIPINQIRNGFSRMLYERYIHQRYGGSVNLYGEHTGGTYATLGTVDGRLDRLDARSEATRLFYDTMGIRVLYQATLPHGVDLREGDRLVSVAGTVTYEVVQASPNQDKEVFTRGYVKKYS